MAILFNDISYLNESFELIEHQDILVEDAYIKDLGAHGELEIPAQTQIIDGKNKLLSPGFYNTHAHAAMTLVRGLGEGLPLQRWLEEAIWPIENQMTEEHLYWANHLAIAEMLRFGIVSFSDMYFHTKARIKSVQESGIKINICDGGTMTIVEKDYDTLPVKEVNDWLFKEVHAQGDGRIRAEFCIHGEYTTPQSMIERVVAEAQKYDAAIHLHLSETKAEVEGSIERHGVSPVVYLESLGVFDQQCTAAHCVWLDDKDIEILGKHQVSCALNPASNMKLGSGFAPVKKLLASNVNLCLGTDGVASNNAHNMMRDLYLLASIYKGAEHDSTVVSPAQALGIATRNGALAQGRKDCGIIKSGMRADLIMIDLDTPWMTPHSDIVSHLVYAANGADIELTMVDGKILYQQGEYKTIDIEKVMYEVDKSYKELSQNID
ncbi:MAG: amidohydrolase [Coriobacteriia bacterium]|nr:amidohydrolase [Coriobacteriia bacterium]